MLLPHAILSRCGPSTYSDGNAVLAPKLQKHCLVPRGALSAICDGIGKEMLDKTVSVCMHCKWLASWWGLAVSPDCILTLSNSCRTSQPHALRYLLNMRATMAKAVDMLQCLQTPAGSSIQLTHLCRSCCGQSHCPAVSHSNMAASLQ